MKNIPFSYIYFHEIENIYNNYKDYKSEPISIIVKNNELVGTFSHFYIHLSYQII